MNTSLLPRTSQREGPRVGARRFLCIAEERLKGSPRLPSGFVHAAPGACGLIANAGIRSRCKDRLAGRLGEYGTCRRCPAAGAAVQREEEIREGLRDRLAAEQVLRAARGAGLPRGVARFGGGVLGLQRPLGGELAPVQVYRGLQMPSLEAFATPPSLGHLELSLQ